MVQRISSGSPFERDMAYSRALVDGDWIFVSGTTGFDYAAMTISDDVAEQADQCFRNIEAALGQANAALADIVRVHYILPDAAWAGCDPSPSLRQRERVTVVGAATRGAADCVAIGALTGAVTGAVTGVATAVAGALPAGS